MRSVCADREQYTEPRWEAHFNRNFEPRIHYRLMGDRNQSLQLV